jgi:hypothetical protein
MTPRAPQESRANVEERKVDELEEALLEMQARADAATRGPWKADKGAGCRSIRGGKSGRHRQAQYREVASTPGLWPDELDAANAEFIAASREDIPNLLAAIREAAWTLRAFAADPCRYEGSKVPAGCCEGEDGCYSCDSRAALSRLASRLRGEKKA